LLYAAVALARSIFRKGAILQAAMAFELACDEPWLPSLAIILVILIGVAIHDCRVRRRAVMVAIMALMFRAFLSPELVSAAKQQADKASRGAWRPCRDGYAVTEGPLVRRIFSAKGFTAASHYFVMDWVAIWFDIVVGLLLAGALLRGYRTAFGAPSFSPDISGLQNCGGQSSVISGDHLVCLLESETFRWPPCSGMVGSVSAGYGVHPGRPDRAPDTGHLQAVLGTKMTGFCRHILRFDDAGGDGDRVRISGARTNPCGQCDEQKSPSFSFRNTACRCPVSGARSGRPG